MKTLSEKQIAQAKKFIKEHNVPAIYVKTENGHMYSEASNALASVAKSDLKEAEEAGLIVVVTEQTKSEEGGGSTSEVPNKNWNVEKLKAFAAEKSIDLGTATKKDEILAAVLKAIEPAQ